VTASFQVAPGPRELTTGVQYRAGVDWAAGLELGKQEAEEDTHHDPDVATGLAGLIDEIKASFSGSLVGSAGFNATVDTGANLLALKKVSVSLSEKKAWGLKVTGLSEPLATGDPGATHKFEFTVSDTHHMQSAVDRITAIQALAAAGGVLNAVVPGAGQFVVGDYLGDQVARLIPLFDEYSRSIERGKGDEIPFGLDGFLEGTGLGGGITIKADSSAEIPTEKGVMKDGTPYKLERYSTGDPRWPNPEENDGPFSLIGDAFAAIRDALAGSYHTETTPAGSASHAAVSSIDQHFSPSGVHIDVQNSPEPTGFDLSLFAYQFHPVFGPVTPAIENPGDVSGPADKPHYGVGGFFQFAPDNRPLAAPADLRITYLDSEAAPFDEQSLAVYSWNPLKRDWDYVGGSVDAVNNTVSTRITRLGLYTVAPPMPAGQFSFSAQSIVGGTPQSPQTTVAYTSSTIRMNNGLVVPDGTAFTVQSLPSSATARIQYGDITTADTDSSLDGVQVTSHNGVIQFSVTYADRRVAARILAFANSGTALANQIIVHP
jgi:hypothetical protein